MPESLQAQTMIPLFEHMSVENTNSLGLNGDVRLLDMNKNMIHVDRAMLWLSFRLKVKHQEKESYLM